MIIKRGLSRVSGKVKKLGIIFLTMLFVLSFFLPYFFASEQYVKGVSAESSADLTKYPLLGKVGSDHMKKFNTIEEFYDYYTQRTKLPFPKLDGRDYYVHPMYVKTPIFLGEHKYEFYKDKINIIRGTGKSDEIEILLPIYKDGKYEADKKEYLETSPFYCSYDTLSGNRFIVCKFKRPYQKEDHYGLNVNYFIASEDPFGQAFDECTHSGGMLGRRVCAFLPILGGGYGPRNYPKSINSKIPRSSTGYVTDEEGNKIGDEESNPYGWKEEWGYQNYIDGYIRLTYWSNGSKIEYDKKRMGWSMVYLNFAPDWVLSPYVTSKIGYQGEDRTTWGEWQYLRTITEKKLMDFATNEDADYAKKITQELYSLIDNNNVYFDDRGNEYYGSDYDARKQTREKIKEYTEDAPGILSNKANFSLLSVIATTDYLESNNIKSVDKLKEIISRGNFLESVSDKNRKAITSCVHFLTESAGNWGCPNTLYSSYLYAKDNLGIDLIEQNKETLIGGDGFESTVDRQWGNIINDIGYRSLSDYRFANDIAFYETRSGAATGVLGESQAETTTCLNGKCRKENYGFWDLFLCFPEDILCAMAKGIMSLEEYVWNNIKGAVDKKILFKVDIGDGSEAGESIGGLGDIVRDIHGVIVSVINSFFLLAFLLGVLFTVLKLPMPEWQLRRMIPGMVLGILLINSSLWITDQIMMIMNYFSSVFMSGGIGGSESIQGIEGIGNTINTLFSVQGRTIGMAFLTALVLLFFVYFYLYLYIILWLRQIVLAILFMLCAIPYFTYVLPIAQIKGMVSTWWENFIKWALMGPIVGLFLYIAVRVSSMTLNVQLGAQGSDLYSTGDQFFKLLLVGALCYLAATYPLKLGGAIMSAAQNFIGSQVTGRAKRAAAAGARAVGRRTAAEAKYGLRKMAATEREGRIAKIGKALAGGTLTAAAMPKMLKERRDKKYEAAEKAAEGALKKGGLTKRIKFPTAPEIKEKAEKMFDNRSAESLMGDIKNTKKSEGDRLIALKAMQMKAQKGGREGQKAMNAIADLRTAGLKDKKGDGFSVKSPISRELFDNFPEYLTKGALETDDNTLRTMRSSLANVQGMDVSDMTGEETKRLSEIIDGTALEKDKEDRIRETLRTGGRALRGRESSIRTAIDNGSESELDEALRGSRVSGKTRDSLRQIVLDNSKREETIENARALRGRRESYVKGQQALRLKNYLADEGLKKSLGGEKGIVKRLKKEVSNVNEALSSSPEEARELSRKYFVPELSRQDESTMTDDEVKLWNDSMNTMINEYEKTGSVDKYLPKRKTRYRSTTPSAKKAASTRRETTRPRTAREVNVPTPTPVEIKPGEKLSEGGIIIPEELE